MKKSYKDDPAILEIKQYLVGLLQTLELIRVWKLYGLSLPNTPTDTCRHIRPKSLHSPQKISPDEICGIGRCGLGGTEEFELFFLDQWSSQSTLVSPKKKWHFI